MHRRIVVLILVLALFGPLAAGATNADMDPDGTPAATGASGLEATAQTEPGGLHMAPELSAWFGSFFRVLLVSWSV
jgi:hypothetical protein